MHTPPSEQAGPGHALLLGASHYLGCRYLCTLCPLFFVGHVLLRPAPFSCGHVNAHVVVVGFSATVLDTLRVCSLVASFLGTLIGCERTQRLEVLRLRVASQDRRGILTGLAGRWGERNGYLCGLCFYSSFCTVRSCRGGKVGPGSSTLCVVVRACWGDGCRRPEAALFVKRQIYECFASEQSTCVHEDI